MKKAPKKSPPARPPSRESRREAAWRQRRPDDARYADDVELMKSGDYLDPECPL